MAKNLEVAPEGHNEGTVRGHRQNDSLSFFLPLRCEVASQNGCEIEGRIGYISIHISVDHSY